MRITYYIFLFFVQVFRFMPFWAVYLFSDFLRFLLLYLVPYRRKVVWSNLTNSFPEKSDREKKKLVRAFYKNLCDILVEGVKGFTMSGESIARRYRFINPEILNDRFAEGQNIIATGAHYANWEWGIMAAPLFLKHKNIAFYTRLSNKYLDVYMRESRERFGSSLLPSQKVRKAFVEEKVKPTSFFFGADQVPFRLKGVHWMEFLNQDTACMKGPEFFARMYKMPVYYFDVQRVRRGHYTVEIFLLEEKSGDTADNEITEKYMRFLEGLIRKKPEDYLWTHRRWKRKRTN
ncbi:MAG: lysophospholipid acyltransferase family protein [Cyclobacteriaceae bacterium]|nr:lysophospholipid acyltransferase family protein [Cyclobacteriaceae bacterium]